MINEKIVIDAANTPIGRLASFAAKQALLGKSVIVINCNEAVISGSKTFILSKYKKARARGGSTLKGPNISKSPEKVLKRTIRGMLSYKQSRGNTALKKIICHNKIPEEFEQSSKTSLQKPFSVKTLTLKELSRTV